MASTINPSPPEPVLALYPYQKRWFLDKSRFKVGMFSRQTGKTFTSTLEIADDCVAHQVAGGRARWVILSRGERQAKEAIDECKRHCRAMQAAIQSYEGEYVSDSGASYRSLEIEFNENVKVTAVPANPDTARGFSANVFLDEFAFHKDSRAIWSALFPVVSNAGQRLIVVSTPNGKGNTFYDLIAGTNTAWSRHVVDIHQAVADGLPRDVEQLRQALNDEEAWRQEFLLEFLDEASAWLPYDLINTAMDDRAGQREEYQGGSCFLGIDIAARRDLFVIAVFELVGDVLWCREIIAERGITFQSQFDHLADVCNRYHVVRAGIDQTGMGEFWVQEAQRRFGTSRMEGVLFTPPRRLELASHLKDAMEDRRTRFPFDDVLRRDLHSVKRIPGATGAPRLVADGDTDGHADRFWAAGLGIAAAHMPTTYGYEPVSIDNGQLGHNGGPSLDGAGQRGPWQARTQPAQHGRALGLGSMKGTW